MAKDKKAVVAIAKEPTVQESVTKVFDLLGGVTNMIKRGETVILKPNAGHAEGPDTAVCTSPETLRAVIREVKKAQPSRIIVAESAAIGCDTMECFEVSGQADCRRYQCSIRLQPTYTNSSGSRYHHGQLRSSCS